MGSSIAHSATPPQLADEAKRIQKTLRDEFYAFMNLQAPDLAEELACWQMYDLASSCGALLGKAPLDRWFERTEVTPYSDEVLAQFDARKEYRRIIVNAPYPRSKGKRCP